MSDIKPGDLVMVVKPSPCCGNNRRMGCLFTVLNEPLKRRGMCLYCGTSSLQTDAEFVIIEPDTSCWRSCLKKIDPPAEGDSLPTRKDLEVPA